MKLREDFLTYTTDGIQYLVPVGNARFSGLVRSNATAACIVDALKQETTKEAIVRQLFERYDAPMEKLEADVERVLEILRQIGALDA